MPLRCSEPPVGEDGRPRGLRCPRRRRKVALWSGAGLLLAAPLAVYVFVHSDPLAAGGEASAEGGIRLVIVDELSVAELQPMALPRVIQGESDAITADSPAEFRIDGEPWENVHIEVEESIELSGPGGAIPLGLSLPDGSRSITASLQFSGSLNFPVDGEIPAGSVPDEPGSYSGSFTVTVNYE